MFPIKVVQDILVCKQDTQETSKGGIVLVGDETKKLRYATVVASGPGKKGADGEFVPNEFKPGHRIAFGRYKSGGYGDEPFVLEGEEYILLRAGDVIGHVVDQEITLKAVA